ncbi:GNAT family N-acetyltransferase [Opitutaceae bacterium]|nr:GNAT family N-acetyltransferase [Opitutaceae bacterium]MDB4474353.1 GNAT family N-acetyltransferase [Opitutaceae bacterium]
MDVEIIQADYSDPKQQRDIPRVLNAYAEDPMGGGTSLSDYSKENLVNKLAEFPHAFSILAYVDGEAAGLVNCFETLSSFACKPLINIHDVVVLEGFRGHGLSQRMLQKVEAIARERGCCKITLEVLSNNTVAKNAYTKFGFAGYELDPAAGQALFWEKEL